MNTIKLLLLISFGILFGNCNKKQSINRYDVISRNNPFITQIDSLSSLSVGNGEFAFTVDATGLQSFQEKYKTGVPLGTQSQWGWHSYPNPNNYQHDETLRDYDFGRGKSEPYSVQFNEPGRQQAAANWFRVNPHRLHLGIIGFDGLQPEKIQDINQELDLWNGHISSEFTVDGEKVNVSTTCHPTLDLVSAEVKSKAKLPIIIKFPYPSGGHCDDACDWTKDDLHSSKIIDQKEGYALIERKLDNTTYYVAVQFNGADLTQNGENSFLITPTDEVYSIQTGFYAEKPTEVKLTHNEITKASENHWNSFWSNGGIVDFANCKDPRAKELERRVVLSQYLLAIQCAGSYPPQETGLTYNSWFGKFHLEMIWWHQAQFALWGREELLSKTLKWYHEAAPIAREIAQRQQFDGLRWMKMTDPSGTEAPSKVGSFLIWQQPHLIYLAELVYRNNPSDEFIKEYYDLIQETAKFMYSFATYDELESRFILKGVIPAQETLRASETINPPFELSYWYYAMSVAQKWRERMGEKRNLAWDEMMDKLSPLTANEDGLYLASEDAVDTYKDIRYTSDHMAVLGAYGILPKAPIVREDYMHNTFDWIYDNWNWGKTWGWDYPMTAMNAVRLGEPEKAINALLMEKRTNTYLINGHNYQDGRLRCYLPGNGGLLTTVALMCAGWDGNKIANPGFPKDGNWNVRWEGLNPMP